MADVIAGRKMSNVKPAGDLDTEIVQIEATSAVPLKGLEDPARGAQPDPLAGCSVVRNLCSSQREK